MGVLSPNDLRHYQTRRIASGFGIGVAATAPPKVGMGPVGPVLRSLDAVLETVRKNAIGGLPRALLVAGTSTSADAASVAVGLARALADGKETVVLVDLAGGPSTVSVPLGMPRVPGFTDLAAGRVTFREVVRLDDATNLQVITAGNPVADYHRAEPERFVRIFEALTLTYDCVVLHADPEAVDARLPALRFELPVAVAVLASGGTLETEREALSLFRSLGCPVVGYDARGKWRLSGLLGQGRERSP